MAELRPRVVPGRRTKVKIPSQERAAMIQNTIPTETPMMSAHVARGSPVAEACSASGTLRAFTFRADAGTFAVAISHHVLRERIHEENEPELHHRDHEADQHPQDVDHERAAAPDDREDRDDDDQEEGERDDDRDER